MGKQTATLPVANAHTAGTDIGSREHWVAVDQDKENVRSFGVYTQDHQHLIDHLQVWHYVGSHGKHGELLANAIPCATESRFLRAISRR